MSDQTTRPQRRLPPRHAALRSPKRLGLGWGATVTTDPNLVMPALMGQDIE